MARAASLSISPRTSPIGDVPPTVDKGRGARSNPAGRYEGRATVAVDDGWAREDEPQRLATDVTEETPRTIINYVDSPFVGFDRSINMYRGCEHGCIYCFARPNHAYYGLSPGRDFEAKLFAKPDAAKLLAKELAKPSYHPAPIAIGTNTDPYQPIEKRYRMMRGILSVLTDFNHPVSILTKSSMVERDIDLIQPLAEAGLARVMLSITTLDRGLARAMEPRASTPGKRLRTVAKLREAGIGVGVMTAPMIPGLNDHELETLIAAAKDAGAEFAGYTMIRLPLEVGDLFKEWLASAYPHRAAKVMRAIREMNGGKDYDSRFRRRRKDGVRTPPPTAQEQLLHQRFLKACKRVDLSATIPTLSVASFRRPVEKGDQLSLF